MSPVSSSYDLVSVCLWQYMLCLSRPIQSASSFIQSLKDGASILFQHSAIALLA